jgi:hypothetical protein
MISKPTIINILRKTATSLVTSKDDCQLQVVSKFESIINIENIADEAYIISIKKVPKAKQL